MRACPRCEAKTDESGTFCPDCGTSFVPGSGHRSEQHGLAETQIKTALRAAAVPDIGVIGVIGVIDAVDAVDANAMTGAIQVQPPENGEPAAANLVGYTIDHQFLIEGVLGGGAFGHVYRGRQLGLDRPVAIKVPTHHIASDPVMAKRFAREARSAAKIQHPGVVAIHAVGELGDGRPYLVMQFVEGEPLDRIFVDGAVPPRRAVRILRTIASALSETHAAGVVHRDLKPSNIMWRRDRNGDDQLTIVDFGIAASKPGTADASRLTAHGLIGTPHYMSPEQAHGEVVDARADLYALGCLLFELVTGAPPFEGSAFEVLLAHLGKQPPAPSTRNPALPEVIDGLVAHLLAKKPDDRPQTADQVVTLADLALAELESSGASSPADEAGDPRTKDRNKKLARVRRPTSRTRPDLPDDYLAVLAGPPRSPMRSRLALRFALGVTAGVVLASTGFLVFGHGRAAPATGGPVENDNATDEGAAPVTGSDAAHLRQINDDDGDVVIHVTVPDPIVAHEAIRSTIEIKNKLGQPIKTAELVVTIADASGPTGLVAHPRRNGPGYAFKYTFPHPGHYVVRVFPPSVASAFEIPLDVK